MRDFTRAGFGVSEERQFTNPHVRFIRRNGRVIPIINKKRIGQEFTSSGDATLKAGLALTTAGAAKHFAAKRIAKSKSFRTSKVSFRKAKKFAIKHSLYSNAKAFKPNFFTKAAIKTVKGGYKHAGKFGLAITAIGAIGSSIGAELQMRSGYGKDFFFTKDQHGKGT